MSLVDKVLAYITRQKEDRWQLLVFDHRDIPDAGTQVPAGTVEPNEPIETALWREVEEESGLRREQLRLIAKLDEYESQSWRTRRHIFHLVVEGTASDTWTRVVQGSGEDRGFIFDYRWIDLEGDIQLAGDQHAWLHLI
jgi:ADP-ribose pyrophosphatase YjhB (NUDIX family)